jgi:RIO-like serine/threonine protein kinase
MGVHEGELIVERAILPRDAAAERNVTVSEQVLYEYGFPVPEPFDQGRHCIVMSLVEGFPL